MKDVSKIDIEEHKRPIPNAEQEEPQRPRERRESAEAIDTQSKTLALDPSLAIPKTDKDDPSLAKLRVEYALPIWAKSSTDKQDPNLDNQVCRMECKYCSVESRIYA